jgi:hypothetical protein
VASWAMRVPAPVVSGPGLLLTIIGGLVIVWLLARRRSGFLVALAALSVFLMGMVPVEPVARLDLDGGGRFWPASGDSVSVLVVAESADRRLAASLVTAGIDTVDIVILERGDRTMRPVAEAVVELLNPSIVLAPRLHQIVGARRVTDPLSITSGSTELRVTVDGKKLIVVATLCDVRQPCGFCPLSE